MAKNTVSVIIPTYNRAHLLSEAINSVIAQDVRDYYTEIIVVDDGSTDETKNVVKRYGSKVRYLHQTNCGAGVARNRGIEAATGEWVAFLDSDDRWLPHKLSLQFKVLDLFTEFNAIHSNFYTFEGNRVIIPKGLEFWVQCLTGISKIDWADVYSSKFNSTDFQITNKGVGFEVHSGNLFSAQLTAPCVSCWTLLVRRECLEPDIRFAEDFPTWEDYWFICKLSEKQDFIFIDTPTAENRSHSGPRLTGTMPSNMLKCHIKTIEKIYFQSASRHRPPTDRINQIHRDLYLSLYKEYVKSGDSSHLKEVYEMLRRIGIPSKDLNFNLYRIASFMPTDVLRSIKRIRKIFERLP